MTEWSLRATAEQPATRWPDLNTALDGWRSAWTDLDGLHIDVPLPATTPITSHLWAWTVGGWFRARIDGTRWWGSVLLADRPAHGELWNAPIPVDAVTVDVIRSWAPEDGRVAQRRTAAGTIPPSMRQLVPVRAQTAVYVGNVDSLPT